MHNEENKNKELKIFNLNMAGTSNDQDKEERPLNLTQDSFNPLHSVVEIDQSYLKTYIPQYHAKHAYINNSCGDIDYSYLNVSDDGIFLSNLANNQYKNTFTYSELLHILGEEELDANYILEETTPRNQFKLTPDTVTFTGTLDLGDLDKGIVEEEYTVSDLTHLLNNYNPPIKIDSDKLTLSGTSILNDTTEQAIEEALDILNDKTNDLEDSLTGNTSDYNFAKDASDSKPTLKVDVNADSFEGVIEEIEKMLKQAYSGISINVNVDYDQDEEEK